MQSYGLGEDLGNSQNKYSVVTKGTPIIRIVTGSLSKKRFHITTIPQTPRRVDDGGAGEEGSYLKSFILFNIWREEQIT